MVTKELLHYVVQALRKKIPTSQLEIAIVQQGWPVSDAQQALQIIREKLVILERLKLVSIILTLATLFCIGSYIAVVKSQFISVGLEKQGKILAAFASPAFYVATNGSDTNVGTIEQPFATLTKARDAIRALGQDGVTVYVRGGTYSANEVVFGPSDSGSAGAPNVYRNYPGENPVFVGGREITLSAGQTGIVNLNLTDYGLGSATVYAVSESGVVKPLARTPNEVTPNYTVSDPWIDSFAKVASDVATTGNKTVIKYENGSIVDPATWGTPTNARAYIYTGENWWPNKVNVASVDAGARTVTLASNTSYDMQYTASGYGQRSFFYLENLPEFMDSPGEWVQVGSTLQYYISGTTTGTEKLRLATTTYLFNINNSSHLVIRGLNLEDTGRQSHGTPGSAIYVTDSDNITIDGIAVHRSAGLGVQIAGVSDHITVSNSRFTDTRHAAIRIDTDSSGSAYFKPLISTNVVFENNYITGVGFGGDLQNVGIFANAPGAIVRNNDISNVVRSGIQADVRQVNVTIENNKMSGLMRQARDGGGIYVNTFSQPGLQRSWLGRGLRVTHNIVQDTGGYGWNADTSSYIFNTWSFGIYLDDWLSGARVTKNVVRDSGGACFLIHAGRDNLFENNICYHASVGSALFYLDEDPNSSTTGLGTYGEVDPKWTEIQNLASLGYDRDAWFAAFPELADVPEIQEFGNIMENNIVRKNIFVKKAGTHTYTYRYRKLSTTNSFSSNVFFDEGAAPFSTYGSLSADCVPASQDWTCQAAKNFAQWQALGFDANSQITNPLFTNLAGGDYTLAANSPALTLGFEQISASNRGLISVAPAVTNVSTSVSQLTVAESLGSSWQPAELGEYETYRTRITDIADNQVKDWQLTDNSSYTWSTSDMQPGNYKLCVEAKNDLRVPSTWLPSDWGSATCASFTLVAVPIPTPLGTASSAPAGSTTSSATPKTVKKSPASSTATPQTSTVTSQPVATLSPSPSVSAENPTPKSSTTPVALRSIDPTTAPFVPETQGSRGLQLSLATLAILTGLGALTTSSLWLMGLRALP
jgi:hypothetical protein